MPYYTATSRLSASTVATGVGLCDVCSSLKPEADLFSYLVELARTGTLTSKHELCQLLAWELVHGVVLPQGAERKPGVKLLAQDKALQLYMHVFASGIE